jgi:hypothetical protein
MRFRLKLELEIVYPQLRIHEIYGVVLVRGHQEEQDIHYEQAWIC